MATRKTVSIYFLARQVNSSFVNILLVLSLKGLSPIIHLICRKCFIPYEIFPELFYPHIITCECIHTLYTQIFFCKKETSAIGRPCLFHRMPVISANVSFLLFKYTIVSPCQLMFLIRTLSTVRNERHFYTPFHPYTFIFYLLCRLDCACCHNIDACTCHIFKDNITNSHRCLNCHAF